MTAEQWKLVPRFPGYFISDQGRVLSAKQREPRILRPGRDNKGYLTVQLSRGNRIYVHRLHRLVAENFHGPCPEGWECRHLNGDKTDNRAANLRWGTQSENTYDRVRHGTHYWASKTHCPKGHEYTPENTYRRPSRPNSRDCRRCHNAKTLARYYARRLAS